jgi:hypothetical protein
MEQHPQSGEADGAGGADARGRAARRQHRSYRSGSFGRRGIASGAGASARSSQTRVGAAVARRISGASVASCRGLRCGGRWCVRGSRRYEVAEHLNEATGGPANAKAAADDMGRGDAWVLASRK